MAQAGRRAVLRIRSSASVPDLFHRDDPDVAFPIVRVRTTARRKSDRAVGLALAPPGEQQPSRCRAPGDRNSGVQGSRGRWPWRAASSGQQPPRARRWLLAAPDRLQIGSKHLMCASGDEQVRDHTRGRDPLLFSHEHHANHLIAPCVHPPVPLGSCTAVFRNRWFGTVSRFDQRPLRNPPPHAVAACSNAGELVSSVAGNWSWTPR